MLGFVIRKHQQPYRKSSRLHPVWLVAPRLCTTSFPTHATELRLRGMFVSRFSPLLETQKTHHFSDLESSPDSEQRQQV